MDSRTKIALGLECLPRLESLRAEKPALCVVSGYFDPLLAWHAARIGDLRRGAPALAVVVNEPADPILPARARAELVASLAAVDLVLVPPGGATVPVSVELEAGDLEQRASFISHVRERQS